VAITWYLLELLRWVDAVWQYPGLPQVSAVLLSPYTYGALIVMLAPVAAVMMVERTRTTG